MLRNAQTLIVGLIEIKASLWSLPQIVITSLEKNEEIIHTW